jgi:hypothetical protein
MGGPAKMSQQEKVYIGERGPDICPNCGMNEDHQTKCCRQLSSIRENFGGPEKMTCKHCGEPHYESIDTIECLQNKLSSLQAVAEELRGVCAQAYQMAGALDAPVEALDNLSAAASGKPLPHKTFLPVVALAKREAVRKNLEWIVNREDYTFAECSLAEEIVRRAKEALRDL